MRAATAALSIPLLSMASAVTRGFSVVLTGQDGFSSDQARGFQPTAQEFQFGVCAPGGTARNAMNREFSAFERAEFPDPCGP